MITFIVIVVLWILLGATAYFLGDLFDEYLNLPDDDKSVGRAVEEVIYDFHWDEIGNFMIISLAGPIAVFVLIFHVLDNLPHRPIIRRKDKS